GRRGLHHLHGTLPRETAGHAELRLVDDARGAAAEHPMEGERAHPAHRTTRTARGPLARRRDGRDNRGWSATGRPPGAAPASGGSMKRLFGPLPLLLLLACGR